MHCTHIVFFIGLRISKSQWTSLDLILSDLKYLYVQRDSIFMRPYVKVGGNATVLIIYCYESFFVILSGKEGKIK